MAKRTEKDPVKQRAGKLGAEARWRNMLRWLRRLVEIRGGTFGPDWRVNLQGVVLMYVMLWRTTLPSLRGRRKWRKDSEIELALAQAIEAEKWAPARRAISRLQHRPKVSLPPAAMEELKTLNKRCDTQLPLETIGAMASYSDNRQRKFPWIHSNWRYDTLERVLKVHGDEIEKLETIRRPRKTHVARSQPAPTSGRGTARNRIPEAEARTDQHPPCAARTEAKPKAGSFLRDGAALSEQSAKTLGINDFLL